MNDEQPINIEEIMQQIRREILLEQATLGKDGRSHRRNHQPKAHAQHHQLPSHLAVGRAHHPTAAHQRKTQRT